MNLTLTSVITSLQGILNAAIPVMVSLGVVFFIWGVLTYVIADAEEAKKTGKDRIIYGIIGLAVITSLWAIVKLVAKTFGLKGTVAPKVTKIACSSSVGSTLRSFATYISCHINNSVIPLLFGVALVVFVWGVVNFFILGSGEEAKRTQGKQFMIWGIIALTVMLCMWGLVAMLGRTVNIL